MNLHNINLGFRRMELSKYILMWCIVMVNKNSFQISWNKTYIYWDNYRVERYADLFF